MYNVVFENIGKNAPGVVTWTTFESKEKLDAWWDDEVKKTFKIIGEGVSEERAKELCSTPEAAAAAVALRFKEMADMLSKI